MNQRPKLRYRRLEDVRRSADLRQAMILAEAANNAKDAFLANMSHEIRTPLNIILGQIHLLTEENPTPAQVVRLNKITAAAERLLLLINDVLDLSRIESEQMPITRSDFQLADVLDYVASQVGEQARDKGLRLDVRHGNTPAWLNGDPVRLRQALLNYAQNAVKFTERGSIGLSARLEAEEGDTLLIRFEVRDSGIGIARDKIPLIFQPFVQADASMTRRYGGSGLGLVITRRLVELMGGETGVDSEPGRGSLFWFTVRLQRAAGKAAAPASTAAVAAAPPDETAIIDGLRRIPGLDVEAGLHVVRNRRSQYLRLLEMFAKSHRDDLDRLRAALAAGDNENARLLAHSLKGVGGNIGAAGLQQAAAAFEAALKAGADGPPREPLLAAVAAAHGDLLAGLHRHLPQLAPPPAAAVDWPALRQLLDELAVLLETADMAAYQRCNQHGEQIRQALGDLGGRLVNEIEAFAFPEALETLTAARLAFPQLAAAQADS